MRKSKAYAAVAVNRVLREQLTQGRPGPEVVVGADLGQFAIRAVPRWADADCARPGRVHNPQEIPQRIGLLVPLARGRRRRLAFEPSGTSGDAWRQARHDADREGLRVSPKAAHDYADICDGVPSQHDGVAPVPPGSANTAKAPQGSPGTWDALRLHRKGGLGVAAPQHPWPQAGVGPERRDEDRRARVVTAGERPGSPP